MPKSRCRQGDDAVGKPCCVCSEPIEIGHQYNYYKTTQFYKHDSCKPDQSNLPWLKRKCIEGDGICGKSCYVCQGILKAGEDVIVHKDRWSHTSCVDTKIGGKWQTKDTAETHRLSNEGRYHGDNRRDDT